MRTLITLTLVALSFNVLGKDQTHVGIIVKKQGQVEILTNPGKSISGKPPHVLYEGLYYSVQKVRPGTKVQNGNIVRTGKDGKIRVVFSNGDQYNVGEGTAYKVEWKSEAKGQKKDPSTISLMYGSLRGIVNKNGPRSGLTVKTRSAVMGVRGTDFHVGQNGTSGTSSLSVLRGKVDLVQKNNPKKVLKVETGVTAEVKSIEQNENKSANKKSTKEVTQITLNKTSKQELVAIDKDSKIEVKEEVKEEIEKLPVEVKKELAKLEKKAVQNTLSDIKDYNPDMYEKLKNKKVENIEEINKQVVAKIYTKAPAKKAKADIGDIDFNSDLYDKYFDIED